MKNLKTSNKLIFSFVIVIVLAVIVGAVGIIGMGSLNSSQARLYSSNLVAVEAMGNLCELFANERNAMRTIILSQNDPDRVKSVMASFTDYENIARENFAAYETTIVDESLESAYYTAKRYFLGDYANLKKDCFALINAGEFDEAYTTYTTMGAPIIGPISEGFAESSELNKIWASDAHSEGASLYMTLTIILVGVLAVAIIVALFFAVYISGLISKPLTSLSTFMKRAATTGDLALSPQDVQTIEKFAAARDEVGQTINNAAEFIKRITQISESLRLIASGDLSVNVSMLSEVDTMGKSLHQMLENLNDMFSNINTSTVQVTTGAKQVADGAQSLAQGATEQAASIQQLSSSIAEIADKTKENAATAEKTSKLSGFIKDNAEKGSHQMDDMITAVKEINDASQSIQKIIKTIDDIAFKTNILALNAAVEAARAGQHGKGFAVVAEEVRNLASQSAEAARDTGDMIQNSMEKAALGSQIAADTATSLKDIVSGINESSQLISEIARASEEQSLGISQINTGIDQVAQVVQNNSATAQQSAAASEQMSSQSIMLEELISRFKLRNDIAARKGIPSSAARQRKPAAALPVGAGDFGKY